MFLLLGRPLPNILLSFSSGLPGSTLPAASAVISETTRTTKLELAGGTLKLLCGWRSFDHAAYCLTSKSWTPPCEWILADLFQKVNFCNRANWASGSSSSMSSSHVSSPHHSMKNRVQQKEEHPYPIQKLEH